MGELIKMGERTTYYKRKRIKSGMSKSDISNELGIDYVKYNAIENGDVKMPSKLMDKFNEIINKGNENVIIKGENKIKADEFWNEMMKNGSNGKRKIYDKMGEFNISGIAELTRLLGYKSSGTLHGYMSGSLKPGDEFKKRIYSFFSDELNIQIPHKKIKNKKYSSNEENDLFKYYEETDFKKLMDNYELANKDIANATGISHSVISRMVSKSNRPGRETLEKVKKFFDNIPSLKEENIKNNEIENVDIKEEQTEHMEQDYMDMTDFVEEEIVPENNIKETESNVVKRYETELSEIDEVISIYNDKIKELEIRKKVCEEVLKVIDEIRNEG